MEGLNSIFNEGIFNNGLTCLVLCLLTSLFLGYFTAPLILWTIVAAVYFYFFQVPLAIWVVFVIFAAIFNIAPLRAQVVSRLVMAVFKKFKFVPKISETERTALDAGVVWVEKDLFSGNPNFKNIMQEPYPQLTEEEKAFLNGPVEELCKMLDPWKILKTREISKEAWDFIKKEKFFGMIIPKKYGGLEFSAYAHSEVIMKISSRSVTAAVTVMVPNSLGPAELIIHYGTEDQKNKLLPRLARGEEVPSFGLTEPLAGSDAGSISSNGVLFKGEDGKLYIRLNWNKRYITLASVSSIIGLGFKLRDPDNLLGRRAVDSGVDSTVGSAVKNAEVGITCALIPANTPGVIIGRRHDPLFIPFHNCPTQGQDVVIPIEAVVGGIEGCGNGWKMLMECLAAGRGISLPAQSTGGTKMSARAVSAHALVRKQFGTSIGKFEGIEEPMARVGASAYALDAMRKFTLGALDKGIKPPVITAMQKYYSTEMGRRVINDAMDVMGGNGISMGPRNLLGETYIASPIGITVEGANIMTRTLIIFGQGALRAHPYAYSEVRALESNDLSGFDKSFWGHVGHIVSNFCRSILLSVTRGYLASTPDCHPQMKVYFRRLKWVSATYAILADIAMGTLGGSLKMKEKLTGRYADILAHMYIATSILRRFEAEGRRSEDLPYAHYMLKYCLAEIQKAFDGIFDNLKIPFFRWFFKGWVGAWSRINSVGSQASDGWSHLIADSMMNDVETRNRLTEGIYLPLAKDQQFGRLEYAFDLVHKSELIEKKIRDAVKARVLPKKKIAQLLEEARSKAVISAEEFQVLVETEKARLDAITVDDFSEAEFLA